MTTNGYTTIGEIKRANAKAGRFWFSKSTVKIFKSKIESSIYIEPPRADYPQGCRCWVESTRTYADDGTREYKLVRFNLATHDIAYIHDGSYHTYRYPTRRAVLDRLRQIILEANECSTM